MGRCGVRGSRSGSTTMIPTPPRSTAESLGYTVLAGAADKPHGLREAYIADPDGYVWVLDRPLAG